MHLYMTNIHHFT